MLFIENTISGAFHCIFGFLGEFLKRIENFKEKENNSKKKSRRLKIDVKIFAKILNNLERLLEKFTFCSQEIVPIKEKTIVLFFQIITQNLIENG